jgi:hypothetical protein
MSSLSVFHFGDKYKISPFGWVKLQIVNCRIKVNSEVLVVYQNKQFSPWDKILLKHLINSVKCHVNINKMMTRVTLNEKY